MINKKWLFATLIMCLCTSLISAQYGIRLKYNKTKYDDWTRDLNNRFASDQKLFKNGYELGVDYWFRLKNRRIEFLPEVAFGLASNSFPDNTVSKATLTHFGINFNTQIYALDLEGDCNCPTFSKEGPSINKGFFFQVSPGIGYHSASIEMDPISSFRFDPATTSGIIGKIGLGVGLDLGVSDFLTVTPMISYYFYTKVKWENFAKEDGQLPVLTTSTSQPTQLQFSVRVGFRNDYNKKRRR
jgi:hypothetical protein